MSISLDQEEANTELRSSLLQYSAAPSVRSDDEGYEDDEEVVVVEEEIVPYLDLYQPAELLPLPNTSDQHQQRLVSLDVFRGLAVALMILVDDAGGVFPSLNHSPWFGVTLADFVMPFFLFIVGVTVGLVLKKLPRSTYKVFLRAIKLFMLGVLLQGGYFHGRRDLTYGVDMDKIRWLGVLQRIAIGYLLASLSEIWLINNISVDSLVAFARKYCIQWMAAASLCIVYLCLLYGIYVPTWYFDDPGMNSTMSTMSSSSTEMVECGVRGTVGPPCNAAGLIDRVLLGKSHIYQHPVYRRTEECSINSPDYGPLPSNSPVWCQAPFDPEGILSSLMAAVTCFVGLHYGHIITHYKGHMQRMILWSISSFSLLVSGCIMHVLGIPLCKPLYTFSYMCVTAGASGFAFAMIYYIVDVQNIRKPTLILQWMGMNALAVYALAACDIVVVALQGFYWSSPENNLVDVTESFFQAMLQSERWGTLAFVMLEIIFWGLVAGFLHWRGIYVKL